MNILQVSGTLTITWWYHPYKERKVKHGQIRIRRDLLRGFEKKTQPEHTQPGETRSAPDREPRSTFFFFLYINAIGFPFDGEGTGLFARKIGSGFSAVGCWRPLSNQSAPWKSPPWWRHHDIGCSIIGRLNERTGLDRVGLNGPSVVRYFKLIRFFHMFTPADSFKKWSCQARFRPCSTKRNSVDIQIRSKWFLKYLDL